MLKTYRIIPLVFIICLFGLTLMTVSPVFAEDSAGSDLKTGKIMIAPQLNKFTRPPMAPPVNTIPLDEDLNKELQNGNRPTMAPPTGVNTVGQSLKNANRQLRSDPPNPQVKVSPWLQSTIEPDTDRKSLSLGAQGNTTPPPPKKFFCAAFPEARNYQECADKKMEACTRHISLC